MQSEKGRFAGSLRAIRSVSVNSSTRSSASPRSLCPTSHDRLCSLPLRIFAKQPCLRVAAEIPVATESAAARGGAARQKSFVINTASLARGMPFLAREKVNANAEGFILRTPTAGAGTSGAFGQDAGEFDLSQAPYISATRLQQLGEGAYIRQAEPVLFCKFRPGKRSWELLQIRSQTENKSQDPRRPQTSLFFRDWHELCCSNPCRPNDLWR